jgi:hypothetical protein
MPQVTQDTLDRRQFIKDNYSKMSDKEMAIAYSEKVGEWHSPRAFKSMRQRMGLEKIPQVNRYENKHGWNYVPKHQQLDRPLKGVKYVITTPEIEKIKTEHKQLTEFRDSFTKIEHGVQVHKIKPYVGGKHSTEAVAVWVASDWHIEERVKKEWVNDLNEHDLDISLSRSEQYFRNALRLTDIFARDVNINRICLALLGDFITNDIHEEMREINILQPMDAILKAQEYIASGINFVLENSNYSLDIVCASGNHGRTTDENYYSTESGHSLEHFMYHSLATFFKGNPRVKFTINNSYHTIVDILGYKVRFHHGHRIKYGGGVGGLYIPVNKKIAIWNNAIPVNLDVFGHFHTMRDGGSFVSNGSQIGYNAYALGNGLPFERPQQAMFLIDSKRGKTISAPILYE